MIYFHSLVLNFVKKYILLQSGACSSVRYGNFCGRNFDWFYDDCITYAMAHNHYINVAKEDVNVQKSRVGQAKSDYFPTLGLGTGYNFYNNMVTYTYQRLFG